MIEVIKVKKPARKPQSPFFSAGPCKKPPSWTPEVLHHALLGRSHRSDVCKAKLKQIIDDVKEVLEIPADYRVGIVPASDTGAVEMAMWSLLGSRPVEVVAWEAFGNDWVVDVFEQLRIEANYHQAPMGELPDLTQINFANDVVFTWNGTTTGVRVPNGDFIPAERAGLTICDATSAAFAMELPWDKLDVTTFSWQKVMGGEAGFGILIISPRTVERLESWKPAWPIPKIFRLTKNGKLNEAIFEGSTINTPSMMCTEDFLFGLSWAKSIGGLEALIARADANAGVIDDFVQKHDWLEYLPKDSRIRSNTGVCLRFNHPLLNDGNIAEFSGQVTSRLEDEKVAHDIKSYRGVPPGLRIWCGSTVETEDIECLMSWVEWAFLQEIDELKSSGLGWT